MYAITRCGLLIMRRSKLEACIDILRALASHGPLKLTHVMYEVNINCNGLKQYLNFLIQHNLVKEQTLRKERCKAKIVYAITGRGRTVLEDFKTIDNALQITEEASNT